MGNWGGVGRCSPSLAEIHVIQAISSGNAVAFPENSCSSVWLDNSSFEQQISDLGKQFAAP